MAEPEDINGDGYADLVLHFEIEDLDLDAETTEVELTGMLLDGTAIVGVDAIHVKK